MAMMTPDSFKQQFEQIAPRYDQTARDWEYQADKVVADAILSADSRGGLHVDLGAGTGKVLQHLQGHFEKAVAIDLTPGMLAQCRAKGLADEFIQCDLTNDNWPVEGGSADAVTAAGLLEFVRRPDDFLKNVASILGRDGVAAVTFELPTFAKKATMGNSFKHSFAVMNEAARDAGLRVRDQNDFCAYKYHGQPVFFGLMTLSRF